MKKFLITILILLLIFSSYILYDTYFYKRVPILDIEEDKVNISELYIYGTHLNMIGNCNFLENMELVLYDGEFIVYDLNDIKVNNMNFNNLIDSSNMEDVNVSFNLSSYVNDGIY